MSNTALHDAPMSQPFHTGDRIRKAREHAGQDRQTFAATIGLHRDTLAKYEDGAKAKRSALISVAWASGVRVEWLETGELPWLATGSNLPPSDYKFAIARVANLSDYRSRRSA